MQVSDAIAPMAVEYLLDVQLMQYRSLAVENCPGGQGMQYSLRPYPAIQMHALAETEPAKLLLPAGHGRQAPAKSVAAAGL